MHDAGPPPTPPVGTPLVEATALEIGFDLQPSPARATTFDGHFEFVVTARNPAERAVTVRLPPYGNDNLGVSFSYLIGSDSVNAVGSFHLAYDPEGTFFRAGETKREAFDLQIGNPSEGNYSAGSYVAYGVFGNHASESRTITLSH
jgi:hypothetical protein